MNRTLTLPANSQDVLTPTITNWFDRQAFEVSNESTKSAEAHSCFSPVHYEAGYAYPLIVWLHGPCSNEDELRQVMPLISMRNHVGVAPRGTHRIETVRGAYGWSHTPASIAEAYDRVEESIASAQDRFNIHPERIFIAGYSEGGTMAHRLGLEHPERFAGAISLGGRVPRGSRVLRNIKRARQLPLLLSVSPTAENCSTEQVMDDVRFIHSAGLPLSVRLYPEGDDLTDTMFRDLNEWVMEQFCASSSAVAS